MPGILTTREYTYAFMDDVESLKLALKEFHLEAINDTLGNNELFRLKERASGWLQSAREKQARDKKERWFPSLETSLFTLFTLIVTTPDLLVLNWWDKRRGWSLLDFAADNNARDVAQWLIIHGADTSSNNFLKIAEGHGYNTFVMLCKAQIKSKIDKIALDSELTEIRNNYDICTIQLIMLSHAAGIDAIKSKFYFDIIKKLYQNNQKLQKQIEQELTKLDELDVYAKLQKWDEMTEKLFLLKQKIESSPHAQVRQEAGKAYDLLLPVYELMAQHQLDQKAALKAIPQILPATEPKIAPTQAKTTAQQPATTRATTSEKQSTTEKKAPATTPTPLKPAAAPVPQETAPKTASTSQAAPTGAAKTTTQQPIHKAQPNQAVEETIPEGYKWPDNKDKYDHADIDSYLNVAINMLPFNGHGTDNFRVHRHTEKVNEFLFLIPSISIAKVPDEDGKVLDLPLFGSVDKYSAAYIPEDVAIIRETFAAKGDKLEFFKNLLANKEKFREFKTLRETLNSYENKWEELEIKLKEVELRLTGKDLVDELYSCIGDNQNAKARIFFPLHIAKDVDDPLAHWIAVEIILSKQKTSLAGRIGYELVVCAHDTLNPTRTLPERVMNDFKDALLRRLQQIHTSITTTIKVTEVPSPFNTIRQNDGSSCGAIVAEEIMKRLRGEELREVYKEGATNLRRAQRSIMAKEYRVRDACLAAQASAQAATQPATADMKVDATPKGHAVPPITVSTQQATTAQQLPATKTTPPDEQPTNKSAEVNANTVTYALGLVEKSTTNSNSSADALDAILDIVIAARPEKQWTKPLLKKLIRQELSEQPAKYLKYIKTDRGLAYLLAWANSQHEVFILAIDSENYLYSADFLGEKIDVFSASGSHAGDDAEKSPVLLGLKNVGGKKTYVGLAIPSGVRWTDIEKFMEEHDLVEEDPETTPEASDGINTGTTAAAAPKPQTNASTQQTPPPVGLPVAPTAQSTQAKTTPDEVNTGTVTYAFGLVEQSTTNSNHPIDALDAILDIIIAARPERKWTKPFLRGAISQELSAHPERYGEVLNILDGFSALLAWAISQHEVFVLFTDDEEYIRYLGCADFQDEAPDETSASEHHKASDTSNIPVLLGLKNVAGKETYVGLALPPGVRWDDIEKIMEEDNETTQEALDVIDINTTSADTSASQMYVETQQKATKYAFDLVKKEIQYHEPGNDLLEAIIALCPLRGWTTQILRDAISQELLANPKKYERAFRKYDYGVLPTSKDEGLIYSSYEEYCQLIKREDVILNTLEMIAFSESQHISCLVSMRVDEVQMTGRKYQTPDNPPILLGISHDRYVALVLPSGKDESALEEMLNADFVTSLDSAYGISGENQSSTQDNNPQTSVSNQPTAPRTSVATVVNFFTPQCGSSSLVLEDVRLDPHGHFANA